jgi:hypothetical protein
MHLKRLLIVSLALALVSCVDVSRSASSGSGSSATDRAATDSAFARLVEELSEPGGYFDTDNLISNETSYLHVVGALEQLGVRGGAYIGVGPDQNFSYIVAIRPSIAFIIDIRRDNLLQHLMFKALFSLARNRIEYLSLLFARPAPRDADEWEDRSIADLIEYLERQGVPADDAELALAAVADQAASFGVQLSDADMETIRRFHGTFIREGPALRFRSYGRTPRPYYPTYRQLLLETDLAGRQVSYLADEDDFQFLKSLQERDLIIPVVGDLGGDYALAGIGRYVAGSGERVSALYTSNVEFYLWRGRGFDRFAATVAQFPYDERSVIIRSYFGRNFGYVHPQSVPGYYSVQLLQTIEGFATDHAAGGYRGYLDLVTRGSIDLRAPAR